MPPIYLNKNYIKKVRNAAASKTAKQKIIFSKVRESEQTRFTCYVKVKLARQIGLRNKRRRKTQKGRNLLITLAKLGTKTLTSTGSLKKELGVGVKALNSDIGKNWWTKG